MLIMGHEVQDLDFLDADVLEKVEKASKKVLMNAKTQQRKQRLNRKLLEISVKLSQDL